MINWWWQSSRLFVCLLLFGCLLLFLSCPFFLSVLASLSSQLGQVRSLGEGGGGGLSLLLYLFVCLPVVQRIFVYLLVYLDCLFVCSLINLDKLARWVVEEEEDSL